MTATQLIPSSSSPTPPLEPLRVFYSQDPALDPNVILGAFGPYHPSLGDVCTDYPLVIPSSFPLCKEVSALLKKYQDTVKLPKTDLTQKEEASEEYLEWQRSFPTDVHFNVHFQFRFTAEEIFKVSDHNWKDIECEKEDRSQLLDLDAGDIAALPTAEMREKHFRLLCLWSLMNRGVDNIDSLRGELLLAMLGSGVHRPECFPSDEWDRRGTCLGLESKNPCRDSTPAQINIFLIICITDQDETYLKLLEEWCQTKEKEGKEEKKHIGLVDTGLKAISWARSTVVWISEYPWSISIRTAVSLTLISVQARCLFPYKLILSILPGYHSSRVQRSF